MRPSGRFTIFRAGARAVALFTGLMILAGGTLRAQVRVDHGRHTRLQRFARDIGYGTVEGLGFAAIDQARDTPAAWGSGTRGYEKRAASNVGEFVIQEGVTEGLAAELKRPLDYTRCGCTATSQRIGHALLGGVADEEPGGAYDLAVPRIAGAYVGALAQASWLPSSSTNRTRLVLVNGTTSLAIGVAINLFHEFVK